MSGVLSALVGSLYVPASSSTELITTAASAYSSRTGSYWVGFRFTVGGAGITVSDLGRAIVATGNKNRTIQLWNFNSFGAYTSLGSVSINTNGVGTGNYLYGTLGSTIALSASTIYLIASDERADDLGWAAQKTVTYTGAISALATAYATTATPGYFDWSGFTSGDTYCGVNLKYT